MDRGTCFSSCSECAVNRLGYVSFHSLLLNQFWIARRSDCSFCKTMTGSLSVATTAVLSAKVPEVDCDEAGRYAEYSRFNNGPRTLAWGTLSLTVYSDSAFTRKYLLCK
jgi:hypothetical protein